MRWFYWKKN